MKQFFFRVTGCFFLFFSAFSWADGKVVERLAPQSFDQCQFSIRETKNLKLGKDSEGSGEYSYCHISLAPPPDLTVESAYVAVIGRGLFENDMRDARDEGTTKNGFLRNSNGNWFFKGTEFLLSPKMLKTSFTNEQCGDETMLVGYQLVRGSIAQGGPITVPGIRILRITPKFVASVELNFQPSHYENQAKGYKQLRESVSKQLVDVVKSIQVTPGIAGPTVRSTAAP